MQIYSDGKNRVIKGSFPKRFKLSNAGVNVPFLRTAEDAIRLSGEIPVGNLDVEEIVKEKVAKPSNFRTMNFVMIGKEDLDRLDVLNQKLAINQDRMDDHLASLTEQELNLLSLETQNAQAIDDTNNKIDEVVKAFGQEIQADRDGLLKTAESFTSSLKQTGDILSLKIEAHEEAKNPHNITKAVIGLERVDNTSDIDKPISKATKKALDEKADKTEIEEVNKKLTEAREKQDSIERSIQNVGLYGGVGGNELPSGGKKGDILVKASNKDGDYKWTDAVSGVEIIRVDELPQKGKSNVLYLVPLEDGEVQNIYEEYIWTIQADGTYDWEKLGSTEVQPLEAGAGIDITNDTISNSGVRSVSTGTTNGTISVNTNGTSAEVSVAGLGTAAYTPTTDYATSAQGTKADSALQGVQINGTDLTIDVNKKVNIPKASNDGTVVGVVQLSNTYGSQTVSGYLAAVDRSYNGFVGATSTSIASVGGVKAYVGGMSVAYNASQSLTDAQKTQARTNIGAGAKTIIREWVG